MMYLNQFRLPTLNLLSTAVFLPTLDSSVENCAEIFDLRQSIGIKITKNWLKNTSIITSDIYLFICCLILPIADLLPTANLF